MYDPESAVYHHHGLHQNNASERVKGVVSIIDWVDKESLNELPQLLRPENTNVAAVIPIAKNIPKSSFEERLVYQTIESLKHAKYVNSIFLVTKNDKLAQKLDVKCIDRNQIPGAESMSLNALMSNVLDVIESAHDYPEALLYANYDYAFRPDGIIDKLILEAQFKGYDTIFPGLVNFGHYWYHNNEDELIQTDPSLESRKKRKPLYRALYEGLWRTA